MTADEPVTGLYFSFSDMETEILNMSKMAKTFLEENTHELIITPWIQQLKNLRTSPPGSRLEWTIQQDRPVKTKRSTGEYEPDANGEHTVFASLSCIWQIATPNTVGQSTRRGSNQTHFVLFGNASTVISVFSFSLDGNHRELARWRFEVGDNESPGCHFHTQVLGGDHDVVFPKTMSVPRLPNLLFTPMDALEFVLAELFQDSWKAHASRKTDAISAWAGCQKRRLINLLKWQQERLHSTSGSPWTSLKAEKPSLKLLLENI